MHGACRQTRHQQTDALHSARRRFLSGRRQAAFTTNITGTVTNSPGTLGRQPAKVPPKSIISSQRSPRGKEGKKVVVGRCRHTLLRSPAPAPPPPPTPPRQDTPPKGIAPVLRGQASPTTPSGCCLAVLGASAYKDPASCFPPNVRQVPLGVHPPPTPLHTERALPAWPAHTLLPCGAPLFAFSFATATILSTHSRRLRPGFFPPTHTQALLPVGILYDSPSLLLFLDISRFFIAISPVLFDYDLRALRPPRISIA